MRRPGRSAELATLPPFTHLCRNQGGHLLASLASQVTAANRRSARSRRRPVVRPLLLSGMDLVEQFRRHFLRPTALGILAAPQEIGAAAAGPQLHRRPALRTSVADLN